MKKIYMVLLSTFIIGCLNAQEWNFSDASFNALGNITSTTTVNDLTIYADTEKDVDIDTNNKSIDDYSFTHRVKLNGSGSWTDDSTPRGRVLSIPVSGSGTVTVYGMSSSSSATRTLNVTSGDKTTLVGEFTTGGSTIDKATFEYTGGATNLYFYSASSGFNVYLIKFDITNSVKSNIAFKETVGEEFYNINGVKITGDFESLGNGIFIKKTIYSDGSTESTKIFKKL